MRFSPPPIFYLMNEMIDNIICHGWSILIKKSTMSPLRRHHLMPYNEFHDAILEEFL